MTSVFSLGRNLAPAGVVRAADQEEIDLAKVPQNVKTAASKVVAGVKWTAAFKSKDEGKTIYDLEGTDEDGRKIEVEVFADGKVVQYQKEVPLKDVPNVVTDALKAKMPKFKVSLAAQVFHDGELVAYHFDGKRPKDKEDIGVLVSLNGKKIAVEEGN